MKERNPLSPIFLTVLIGALVSIGFGQESQAVSLNLLKWQDRSSVQVVGVTSGETSAIEEVYLFNSGEHPIEAIKIGAILHRISLESPKVQSGTDVLVSPWIPVSLPSRSVVRLSKMGLWSPQMVKQVIPPGLSGSLSLKVGIESSRSNDGNVFETSLITEKRFESTRRDSQDHQNFDRAWSEFGALQLERLTSESLLIESRNSEIATSQSKLPNQLECASLAPGFCRNNQFPYDTSWCRQDTQTTCSTFQCDPTKPCPKSSCSTVLELVDKSEQTTKRPNN